MASLAKIKTLEEIDLTYTCLGDAGAEILSQNIKLAVEVYLWNVKIVKMNNCNLTAAGL